MSSPPIRVLHRLFQCRYSNSRDVGASSPSFSSPVTRVPRRACSQAITSVETQWKTVQLSGQKVVMAAYEWWLFTPCSCCRALSGKRLAFCIKVLAYRRWSLTRDGHSVGEQTTEPQVHELSPWTTHIDYSKMNYAAEVK